MFFEFDEDIDPVAVSVVVLEDLFGFGFESLLAQQRSELTVQ